MSTWFLYAHDEAHFGSKNLLEKFPSLEAAQEHRKMLLRENSWRDLTIHDHLLPIAKWFVYKHDGTLLGEFYDRNDAIKFRKYPQKMRRKQKMGMRADYKMLLQRKLQEAIKNGEVDDAKNLSEELASLNKEELDVENSTDDPESVADRLEELDVEFEEKMLDDDPVRERREIYDDQMWLYHHIGGIGGFPDGE